MRLFYQQVRSLYSRLGFRRSVPFDVDERGDECNLKLNLFAPQRGRGWQRSDLIEGPSELGYGFGQRRACQ